MPRSYPISPPPPVSARVPFPPSHMVTARPASLNPPNIQIFRVDYQYGVYIILSVDVNNYYDVFDGPGSYTGPPSWLTQCDIYYSGTLQYTLSSISGIVWVSNNSYPFNDPSNLNPSPGIAFWTSDNNIGANYFDLMSIVSRSYDNIYITNVSFAYPCFKEGSKILTEHGYRPIEQLRKGDKVMTYFHGLKAIDMIGCREIYHPANTERIVDQLYSCSPCAYPELTEDLVLTGAHSILIAEFKNEEEKQRVIEVNGKAYVTDGKLRLPACVDERTTVYEIPGTYMIYHLALEHSDYYMNYGVYANGLLVETCSKRYMKELSQMTLLE